MLGAVAMNRFLFVALLFAVASIPGSYGQSAPHLHNPFFAYELGEKTPEEQAELVKEFGFDGTVFDGAKLVAQRLKALDNQSLALFFLWLTVDVGGGQTAYEPGMDAAIRELKGRGTVVWLAIKGGGEGAEQRAIEAVRKVSDVAAESNLRVALYPHYGFYMPTLKDALRIAGEAQRSNLGVTFNLCHELRSGLDPDIQDSLQRALPRLYGVTINGADREGHDWDRLIQPLDRGDFNVVALLRTMVKIGYRGPVGLQCYGIKEDPRIYLPRSMNAWRKMSAEIAGR